MKKSIPRSQGKTKQKSVRRSKKHSRTSPEIQFKELNEKLRRTLTDQQINRTFPPRTQTKSSQKIEKLKESKLNKIYSLLKLEAFKPMPKFSPFKKTLFQKYVQNQFLFLKSVQYYICKTWKVFIGPWRSMINSKWPKNLKKSIANYQKMLLKIVI